MTTKTLFHEFTADSMDQLKKDLVDFHKNNCYHIVNHTFKQEGNDKFTLTIEYI